MGDIYVNGSIQGANYDLTAIKTETDKIALIKSSTDKFFDAECLGPADTDYSLSWHLGLMHAQKYARERWLGLHNTPNGTINRAQDLGDGGNNAPFVITTGATNGAWGAWVQVFGTGDGPFSVAGFNMFLATNFAIQEVNSTAPYVLEAAAGPDLPTAEYIGLTLGRSVNVFYKANSTATDSMVNPIVGGIVPLGYGVWVRALSVGTASKTISLYYSVVEMQGNIGGLRY